MRSAISLRSPSRSRRNVGRWRQDTLDVRVSSEVRRLSISGAKWSAPWLAANSIRSWRFSSGRALATARRSLARRSAPSPAKFSAVTRLRLAVVGGFIGTPVELDGGEGIGDAMQLVKRAGSHFECQVYWVCSDEAVPLRLLGCVIYTR